MPRGLPWEGLRVGLGRVLKGEGAAYAKAPVLFEERRAARVTGEWLSRGRVIRNEEEMGRGQISWVLQGYSKEFGFNSVCSWEEF